MKFGRRLDEESFMASTGIERANEEPQEEFFDNEATNLEVEEVGDGGRKPWDPSKIRISTKPFSLRQIVDMITDHDIDLAPDFQRLFVWKRAQRSRLIESILLGIPLPAFYFNQDFEGAMQVVDGVQRLTTISQFVRGAEELSDVEYLQDLEGKFFADLDVVLKRRFQQTQIFVNVIEPQTPDDVKFDVFRRINTGGSPLTPQEIRHCMSRKQTRDLLKRLISLPSFALATDNAFRNERRMADREVVLRFCAFRSLSDIDDYKAFTSLDSFLLDFTRRIDGTHSNGIPVNTDTLVADFERAMTSAAAIFDNAAFRKFSSRLNRRGPINRALFDSWAAALADYDPAQVAPFKLAIVAATRKRLEERDYVDAISQGTGDIGKVRLRFNAARKILNDIVGAPK